ncbi:MAG: phasin family protein [Proteobacteria bacterium]|nr:phasin family protein [Pseudomonadota bacterium]
MGSHDHIGEVPMFPLQNFYTPTGTARLNDLMSFYQGSFVCAQRLVSLNLKAAQSLMEGNLETVQTLARARDLQSWNKAQVALTEHFIDQVIGYAGDFNEVVAANQHELAELLNLHSDKPGKTPTAPPSMLTAGPAIVDQMVRSMLDAAIKSRDAMLDMAKQADASLPRPPARKRS